MAHGDVADLRGDWAGARDWYQKSIRLAPSLPAGYYALGAGLARHGDLNGALTQYGLAHDRGPHWAEPLKGRADVLAQQGRNTEALTAYDEALQRAPHWQALIDARAALAQR